MNTCEQYYINIKPTKVYKQFECRSPKRWAKFVQLRKTFTEKTAHILLPSDLIHDQDNNKNGLATSESRLRVHIINLIIRVLIWGDIKAEFKCIYIPDYPF